MAIRCSYPCALIPRKTNKTATRVFALHNSSKQHNRESTPLIKSCMINKQVFEDQETGITCYRDERGELICEGYDEGPRISRQPPQEANGQRSIHMPDVQQPLLLRLGEDVDRRGVNGVTVQELKYRLIHN